MGWTEIDPPSGPAISVKDLRDHLRVTNVEDDPLLQLYATAATQIAELKTRRALVNRTILYEIPCFPDNDILTLPLAPVSSLTSIQYYDVSGTLQTLSTSAYVTDLNAVMPIISRTYGSIWPVVYKRTNAVQITFVAGYGDDPDSIPEGLQMAILLLAAHFYENRVPVEVGTRIAMVSVPLTLQYALDAYKIVSL